MMKKIILLLCASVFFLFTQKIISQNKNINLVKGLSKNKIEKENLGKNINSKNSEYVPVISQDDKTLYLFVYGDKNNIGEGDIWYSNKNNNSEWGKRKNIGKPLNNEASNFVISVSPDNNTLFLSRRYKKKGNTIIDAGKGFSLTHRIKNGWSKPVNVNIKDFKNKSKYGEFCMSADQKTLLHAIQMKDSYGDQDLYVSFKLSNNEWTKPKNLGKNINTKGAENAPFLASDGVTLYFSTNGRPGYGANDIFLTRRLDNTWTNWSEPENLGPSINSSKVDSYFTIPASGKYAYLVSEENSHGKADIWRIKLDEVLKPRPVILVYGKVLNSETKKPIDASITYRMLETNEEVGIAISNPNTGDYKIILPAGSIYSFMANKNQFITVSENINLKENKQYKEIERNLYLTPIKIGATVHLNNLFFITGKSEINKWSQPELTRLINLLKQHQKMQIEISGHTDNIGSNKINNKLSLERANAVKKYLINNGISEKQLITKGYGKSKPYVSNKTAAGRKKNRRVDFTILKM